MNIALLEPLGVSRKLIEELSAPICQMGHEFTAYDQKAQNADELVRRAKDCDCVMIANTPFPDAVIRACPNLRYINVAFTGIDHVGLDACRERGILVSNAANYSNETVAELVIGMVISLMRKIPGGDSAVRAGGTSRGLTGLEIAGKTVGIVGLGRIGMRVAQLFSAFGAQVIAASPHEKEEAKALGIRYVPLDTLMKEADIISIHTPNTPATKGLISREKIALMKPSAIFINCARGPIVDSAALADALNEGRIAAAGVDVYDKEPPLDDEPLLHAKNTLLTPHVGFLSHEAMVRRAHIAFDSMQAYLRGEPENLCRF